MENRSRNTNALMWDKLYSNLNERSRSDAEIDSVPELDMDYWGQSERLYGESRVLVDHIPRDSRFILDLGCGGGHVLGCLLNLNTRYIGYGIDISNVAVKKAREQALKHGLNDRLFFYNENIHGDWEIPKTTFDFVYSYGVLQFSFFSQFCLLCEKIGGLLNPGGVFTIKVRSTSRSVPNSYEPTEEDNTYISREPHEDGMIYHHYTENELNFVASILEAEILHCQEIKQVRDYDPFPERAWWEYVYKKE